MSYFYYVSYYFGKNSNELSEDLFFLSTQCLCSATFKNRLPFSVHSSLLPLSSITTAVIVIFLSDACVLTLLCRKVLLIAQIESAK